MTTEDDKTAEIVDPASFSFPAQNRFDSRPEMQAGWGGNWPCRPASVKRKKIRSSSIDNDSVIMLSNDEKLVCLFETLNKKYDTRSSLEEIQTVHC